eukprot:CAMPEP_0197542428 /NCGR_PEP_ID=MMETSP1318-20131121/67699_1 /TAXON_ID=552666 /ORGANISM="Partenskyella glossopodia, Strain RCC365" /LENGTH=384 /DNA_ID=CAMNT_0043101691 /DNA_START=409 /DNA_END=1563 /DNA_ORIENTATION=+
MNPTSTSTQHPPSSKRSVLVNTQQSPTRATHAATHAALNQNANPEAATTKAALEQYYRTNSLFNELDDQQHQLQRHPTPQPTPSLSSIFVHMNKPDSSHVTSRPTPSITEFFRKHGLNKQPSDNTDAQTGTTPRPTPSVSSIFSNYHPNALPTPKPTSLPTESITTILKYSHPKINPTSTSTQHPPSSKRSVLGNAQQSPTRTPHSHVPIRVPVTQSPITPSRTPVTAVLRTPAPRAPFASPPRASRTPRGGRYFQGDVNNYEKYSDYAEVLDKAQQLMDVDQSSIEQPQSFSNNQQRERRGSGSRERRGSRSRRRRYRIQDDVDMHDDDNNDGGYIPDVQAGAFFDPPDADSHLPSEHHEHREEAGIFKATSITIKCIQIIKR